MRALTRASGRFLKAPPVGFAEHPLLTPRGLLFLARSDQTATLGALETEMREAGAEPRALAWREAVMRVPILSPDYGEAALLDPEAMDIDVHGLLQGYLRAFRGVGGTLVCDAEVIALDRSGGTWKATTARGRFAAPVVINAAGAWADAVAELAGVPALSIAPLRRTLASVAAPEGIAVSGWPMVNGPWNSLMIRPG